MVYFMLIAVYGKMIVTKLSGSSAKKTKNHWILGLCHMMSVFDNYIYYIQSKNSSYPKAAPERSEALIRDSGAELNHARSARIPQDSRPILKKCISISQHEMFGNRWCRIYRLSHDPAFFGPRT